MSRRVRCAIYTRKSTEEGLDQAFNSLDAQREACEAYVRSQAGEGWKALPERYDDGGYSGGDLHRPAMQQLLADVEAGKFDVIVVYKVDRLTRSLVDFAKIVERLDEREVSFVSVTQAFNTTTSMGRLTLNVLLSFAQFEREVTCERIRDKIAASKAKGIWMGGNVPLGYDLHERRLVVNQTEAQQVRHIFSRYLELGSGVALAKEVHREGVRSKRWLSRSGQERGGAPFSCGALYYLLQNRLYLGEIVHRGIAHTGEHEAIVDRKLFNAVQETLATRRGARRKRPTRAARCELAGLLVDSDGRPMTTSFSYGRGGKLYRYYVAGSLNPLRAGESPPARVPAAPLERLVLETIGSLLQRQLTLSEVLPLVAAVELRDRSIQLVLQSVAFTEPHEPVDAVLNRLQRRALSHRVIADGDHLRVIIDRSPVFRGGTASRSHPAQGSASETRLALLRSAHRLLERHSMSAADTAAHAHATAPRWQRQRRTMALGLLAPQLQKALLRGSHGEWIDQFLIESPPFAWADQISFAEKSYKKGYGRTRAAP